MSKISGCGTTRAEVGIGDPVFPYSTSIMSLSTPVALIIFNRPDLTEIVFEAIAQAKPKKLLVIADGPRFPEEAEKCQQARAVIEKVDWDCEVLTNFSEENLGCKQRVFSGLDWVFEQVEEAIILEDDCLPSPSFFYFCQTLLERYRTNEKIMHIAGTKFVSGDLKTNASYYFSKYPYIWGWASWRRAWQNYDVEIKTWPQFKEWGMMRSSHEDPYEQRYWTSIFDRVFNGFDTWDWQWYYACYSQNGLSIVPKVNLVSNIGFGPDATHTITETRRPGRQKSEIWEIIHPPSIVRDRDADAYTFDYHWGGKNIKQNNTLLAKVKRKTREYQGVLTQQLSSLWTKFR
jgi:hypothetical protein